MERWESKSSFCSWLEPAVCRVGGHSPLGLIIYWTLSVIGVFEEAGGYLMVSLENLFCVSGEVEG